MSQKYGLAYNKLSEINTMLASAVASADYVIVEDNSLDVPKRVLASNFGIQRSAADQLVYNVKATATLAEINAGKVLVAAETGVTLRAIGYLATVVGSFASGTTVDIEDDNGTPVVVGLLSQANLTNGSKLRDGDTGASRGAGLGGDLTAAKGISVTKTGADFTAGTSITFDIQYTKSV